MFINLLQKLFSYLFPPQCIVCGSEEVTINICKSCGSTLPVNREIKQPWIFSLYQYRNDTTNACVRHLKNYPDQVMVEQLLLERKLMIIGWITGIARYHGANNIILIPVPLHQSRFIERGYNQAEIIAGAIKTIMSDAKNFTVIIETNLITKSKKTDKQALIHDRAIRLKNISGAFSIKPDYMNLFPENTIGIIIDDITTTGGTLIEIRQLFTGIEERIFGFTLGH
jgi:predicted amidophosphoribosyltransferase